jgi:hypothetical protein
MRRNYPGRSVPSASAPSGASRRPPWSQAWYEVLRRTGKPQLADFALWVACGEALGMKPGEAVAAARPIAPRPSRPPRARTSTSRWPSWSAAKTRNAWFRVGFGRPDPKPCIPARIASGEMFKVIQGGN